MTFIQNSDKIKKQRKKKQQKITSFYYIVNHIIYFISFIFLYIFCWFFLTDNVIKNIFVAVITSDEGKITIDIKNLFLAFSIIEISIIVIALFMNGIRYAYKNIWGYEKGELFGNKKEEEIQKKRFLHK